MYDLSDFFFSAPATYDEKALKNWNTDTLTYLSELMDILNKTTSFKAQDLEVVVNEWIAQKEMGIGKVMQPLRISLVGAMKGPDVFAIAELLGKEEVLNRIASAMAFKR